MSYMMIIDKVLNMSWLFTYMASAPQYVLHIAVKKETFDLYMKRYEELKGKDRRNTHDELMRALLGMR